jgi:hypothetical protein
VLTLTSRTKTKKESESVIEGGRLLPGLIFSGVRFVNLTALPENSNGNGREKSSNLNKELKICRVYLLVPWLQQAQ